MEALQREDRKLRGLYGECPEPALESCMKIQRSAGVNGRKSRIYESVCQSGWYRRDFGPLWDGVSAFFRRRKHNYKI